MALPALLQHQRITPDEVRATRETNGWTVEEFADVLWVSPLEVSAWEAGTVTPSPLEAEWVRWHARMAERDRAYGPGGIEPCEWVRTYPARSAGSDRRGAHRSDVPWNRMQVHLAACAACRRAAELDAALPPVPQPGNTAGNVWLWMDTLPFPLDFAAKTGGAAVLLMAGLLFLEASSWIQHPSEGFGVPLTPFATLLAGVSLADPGVWILTGFFSIMIGGVAGHAAADRPDAHVAH